MGNMNEKDNGIKYMFINMDGLRYVREEVEDMDRLTKIGKAIIQKYLFIDNERYDIIEVKTNGVLRFSLSNEKGAYSGYVDVCNNIWRAEPQLSSEDKIRVDMLRELDYCYLRVDENYADISCDEDFEEYDRVYCFNNLPKGMYEIGEDDYNIHYLGGL